MPITRSERNHALTEVAIKVLLSKEHSASEIDRIIGIFKANLDILPAAYLVPFFNAYQNKENVPELALKKHSTPTLKQKLLDTLACQRIMALISPTNESFSSPSMLKFIELFKQCIKEDAKLLINFCFAELQTIILQMPAQSADVKLAKATLTTLFNQHAPALHHFDSSNIFIIELFCGLTPAQLLALQAIPLKQNNIDAVNFNFFLELRLNPPRRDYTISQIWFQIALDLDKPVLLIKIAEELLQQKSADNVALATRIYKMIIDNCQKQSREDAAQLLVRIITNEEPKQSPAFIVQAACLKLATIATSDTLKNIPMVKLKMIGMLLEKINVMAATAFYSHIHTEAITARLKEIAKQIESQQKKPNEQKSEERSYDQNLALVYATLFNRVNRDRETSTYSTTQHEEFYYLKWIESARNSSLAEARLTKLAMDRRRTHHGWQEDAYYYLYLAEPNDFAKAESLFLKANEDKTGFSQLGAGEAAFQTGRLTRDKACLKRAMIHYVEAAKRFEKFHFPLDEIMIRLENLRLLLESQEFIDLYFDLYTTLFEITHNPIYRERADLHATPSQKKAVATKWLEDLQHANKPEQYQAKLAELRILRLQAILDVLQNPGTQWQNYLYSDFFAELAERHQKPSELLLEIETQLLSRLESAWLETANNSYLNSMLSLYYKCAQAAPSKQQTNNSLESQTLNHKIAAILATRIICSTLQSNPLAPLRFAQTDLDFIRTNKRAYPEVALISAYRKNQLSRVSGDTKEDNLIALLYRARLRINDLAGTNGFLSKMQGLGTQRKLDWLYEIVYCYKKIKRLITQDPHLGATYHIPKRGMTLLKQEVAAYLARVPGILKTLVGDNPSSRRKAIEHLLEDHTLPPIKSPRPFDSSFATLHARFQEELGPSIMPVNKPSLTVATEDNAPATPRVADSKQPIVSTPRAIRRTSLTPVDKEEKYAATSLRR